MAVTNCMWMCSLVFLYSITTGTAGARCGEGWLAFGQSCYLLKDFKQDWATAQSVCAQLDAKLVEVEKADEDSFLIDEILKKHSRSGPKVQYWIGGNAIEKSGRFMWTSSRSLFSNMYTNWYFNQPNNGGEECVCYDVSYDDKTVYTRVAWHDYPCTSQSFFICERVMF